MEFERMKSPECNNRDLSAPSFVIFSFEEVIYFAPGATSPILIQLIPSLSLVI